MAVPEWFLDNLGWKQATKKATARCVDYFGRPLGPNLADLSGTGSTRIAGRVYQILGIPMTQIVRHDIGDLEKSTNDNESRSSTGTAAGTELELGLERDIREGLQDQAPGRDWLVTRSGSAGQFAQYQHLAHLQQLFESDRTLKTTVGRDYEVSTDVMVGLPSQWATAAKYILHAAISSKLTIRSDRVQNVRVEFGSLVRNRRGRLPHLVVVTAEPLPSRIISIGRGTGEIDTVYHLLFDEISEALGSLRTEGRHMERQWSDWCELVDMRRLRPYSELVPVLAQG
jgi:hypothetical protein